jgi:hypothetical protein
LLDDFADARESNRVLCGPYRQRLSHRESPFYFAFYSLRYHAAAAGATVFLMKM